MLSMSMSAFVNDDARNGISDAQGKRGECRHTARGRRGYP